MRPGGLGSTQLIQKLAQLAWYWWPPYSSLKLSVSELNACHSERVRDHTPASERGINPSELTGGEAGYETLSYAFTVW